MMLLCGCFSILVFSESTHSHMYIVEKTLDDVLLRVFQKLLKTKNRISPTRGKASEYTGALLKIKNPRARLSQTEKKGKLFSCLGELLWYLSRMNDLEFIKYYLPHYNTESDDGLTVFGGYGPLLFEKRGENQIENVITLLKKNPFSRRAVIQLFDAADFNYKGKGTVPCTCTLQFLIRDKRLHMFINMRSNDAFLGLPHDIFAFTMLQEIMAMSLDVKLGTYNHSVGSLHLYDKHRKGAEEFVREGWQPKVEMPPMPKGDPWESIKTVLEVESEIRKGNEIDMSTLNLEPFWCDIVYILQIYWYSKKRQNSKIAQIKKKMSTRVYDPYIQRRQASKSASIKV